MSYVVKIRDNATKEIRSALQDFDWSDSSLFWWTEGNFGCDCNRMDEFKRAGGELCTDNEAECSHQKYSVLDATLPDGTVIAIDLA